VKLTDDPNKFTASSAKRSAGLLGAVIEVWGAAAGEELKTVR